MKSNDKDCMKALLWMLRWVTIVAYHWPIIASSLPERFNYRRLIKQSARQNITWWQLECSTTLSLSENVFHVASENINFRPPEPAVECSKQVIPEFPGVLPFLVLPLCRSARLRRYVAGWPYVRTLAPQGNNPLTVRMPMRKLKFSHNSIKSGKNKTFCRTKIAPLHGLQFCRTKWTNSSPSGLDVRDHLAALDFSIYTIPIHYEQSHRGILQGAKNKGNL